MVLHRRKSPRAKEVNQDPPQIVPHQSNLPEAKETKNQNQEVLETLNHSEHK